MTLYVLDTDILTHYQLGQPSVCQRVASHRPEELAVTIISVEEQLSSWYTLRRRVKKRELGRLTIIGSTDHGAGVIDRDLVAARGVDVKPPDQAVVPAGPPRRSSPPRNLFFEGRHRNTSTC